MRQTCSNCGLQKELTQNTYRQTKYWRYSLPRTTPCKKHIWTENHTIHYIIDEFIMWNVIYSQDTMSLVVRLLDKWRVKFPESRFDAQQDAWKAVADIQKERESIDGRSVRE